MANILIIDDQETNLKILRILLEKEGYKVFPALSGTIALALIEEKEENFFDLILSDINMPIMSGFDFCKILRNENKYRLKCLETPIIFVSALTNSDDITQGLELGGADYITKPFNTKEIKLRVKNHLKMRELQQDLEEYNHSLLDKVAMQSKQLVQMQMSVIFSLAKLAQSRDDDTGKHLERVQIFCKLLAEEFIEQNTFSELVEKNFIEDIYHASPLHDIGKVGISDLILLKPGKLNEEEYNIMKTHTVIGATTLQEVNQKFKGNSFIEMGILIARYHHERWDGNGYPDGLSEVKIPLCARIMAIADVYDALKSKRVYKDGFPHEKCVEIIKEGAGTQFDPMLVSLFLDINQSFYEAWQGLQ